MARDELLTESVERVLELSVAEAEALRATGRRLASSKTWWGATEPDDGLNHDRTVIRVRSAGEGRWSVRVADAVGVISVGTLQLIVRPKIPLDHLLFLFSRSAAVPRPDEQRATTGADRTLWDLVAEWFVGTFERLLRADLVRDYQETTEELSAARGRIHDVESTRSYYAGRLDLLCTHDEFALDTALNRVLLAASRMVAAHPGRDKSVRQRALRLMARVEGVGDLQPSDLLVTVDRRTAHYHDALTLAHALLANSGRTITEGGALAWTFLIRTPDLVESGVLRILQEALSPHRVMKEGRRLADSAITFNPDLVFDGGLAVGDVKYKLSLGDWVRHDLYQVIAFAEAFGVDHALIIRFREESVRTMPTTRVGRKIITEATWSLRAGVSPEESAAELCSAVAAWLGSIAAPRPAMPQLLPASA